MNFWRQLVGCVMRPQEYPDLIKKPAEKALAYLVVLTLIISVLYGIRIAVTWNTMVDTAVTEFASKAPDFLFANGEIKVDAPMPYVVSKTNKTLFIIDTSGKTDEQILKKYDTGVFIGKTKIVNKKSPVESDMYDVSTVKDYTVSKADFLAFIPWIKWANIGIALFLCVSGVVSNLGSALLVSIGGWIISRIMRCKILFSELYLMAVYALTLPLLLEMVKDTAELKVPFFTWGFYIIAFIYVIQVIRIIKKNRAAAEVTGEL